MVPARKPGELAGPAVLVAVVKCGGPPGPTIQVRNVSKLAERLSLFLTHLFVDTGIFLASQKKSIPPLKFFHVFVDFFAVI